MARRNSKKDGNTVAKTVYLDRKLHDEAERIGKEYNVSFSSVICDAAEKTIMGKKQSEQDLSEKIDNLTAAFYDHRRKTSENHYLLFELLMHSIKEQIIHTPDIPDDQKKAARAEGASRFEKFLEDYQKAMTSGDAVSEGLFKDED